MNRFHVYHRLAGQLDPKRSVDVTSLDCSCWLFKKRPENRKNPGFLALIGQFSLKDAGFCPHLANCRLPVPVGPVYSILSESNRFGDRIRIAVISIFLDSRREVRTPCRFGIQIAGTGHRNAVSH
jgi:hypothetical protein